MGEGTDGQTDWIDNNDDLAIELMFDERKGDTSKGLLFMEKSQEEKKICEVVGNVAHW